MGLIDALLLDPAPSEAHNFALKHDWDCLTPRWLELLSRASRKALSWQRTGRQSLKVIDRNSSPNSRSESAPAYGLS